MNNTPKYYSFKSTSPLRRFLQNTYSIIFGISALILSTIMLIITISTQNILGILFSAFMRLGAVMILKLISKKNYGVFLLEDRIEFDLNNAARFADYNYRIRSSAVTNTETKTVYYKEIHNFYAENMTEKNKREYDKAYISIFYPQGKYVTKGECIILVADSEKQERRNIYCFSVENQSSFLADLETRFNNA